MADFSDLHQNIILHAAKECINFENDTLLPEHYLLSILTTKWGIGFTLLMECGLDVAETQKELILFLESQKKLIYSKKIEEIPISVEFSSLITTAGKIAKDRGSDIISTEHTIMAMASVKSGLIKNLFDNSNVTLNKLDYVYDKLLVEGHRGDEEKDNLVTAGTNNGKQSSREPLIKVFGTDLNQKVREGKIGRIIGREKEINRLVHILCRMNKNNPLLVGEAGVGKTAILEGLATRIVKKETPKDLHDKRVILLDLAMLVAGTKYRGEFEQRLKTIIKEVEKDPTIILAIDEVHMIVSAGNAEGAMDAANILKPALANGEIRCIGSTTSKEYRKSIEPDAALSRRFSTIRIEQPSKEQTLSILKGIAPQYEKFHGIKFPEEVLNYIVKISSRYVSDKNFPDKAIDIMDEVGSKKKLQYVRKNLTIEKIEESISSVETKISKFMEEKKWDLCEKEQKKREDLYDKLQKEEIKEMKNVSNEQRVITIDEIAETVSDMTGVPISKSTEDVSSLRKIKEQLGHFIKGQDEAVEAICKAVIRGKTGLKSPKKPIATFLFAGKTGVGKTETARKLARIVFGDEADLIREDMSAYSERHSVSGLVGCFAGGSKVEVLGKGEVQIQDVSVGDMVLTHMGRYRKVIDRHSYKHSGKLRRIFIHGESAPIECTESHEFLAFRQEGENKKIQWLRADELFVGDNLLIPINSEGSQEKVGKKSNILMIYYLWKILSVILSVGSTAFSFWKKNKEFQEMDGLGLRLRDYGIAKITKNVNRNVKENVYDLSVEEDSSYTVSRVAVHNSPPGYIGFGEGGNLSNKIKQKPYSVILLDEVEKADPKVWEIFLPMFDEGRLIDKKTGEAVDCKNTIIIMTTNLGSQIGDYDSIGFSGHGESEEIDRYLKMKEKTEKVIKKKMNPEFLNRIDDIIVFKELGKESLNDIVNLIIDEYNQHIHDVRGFTVKFSQPLIDHIIEEGYSSKFGARELRRTIDRLFLDELADFYIQHSDEGDPIGRRLRQGSEVVCKLGKDNKVSFSVGSIAKKKVVKSVKKQKCTA